MIYKDIYECPIKIYHRIIESKDVSLLGDAPEKELWEIFYSMQDSLVDIFGVSDLMFLIYHKQKTINKLEVKLLEGDAAAETNLTFAKIQMKRLQTRADRERQEDVSKVHVRLRRAVEIEYKRDIDKLTVHEFYTDLQDIQEKSGRERMKGAATKKLKAKKVG